MVTGFGAQHSEMKKILLIGPSQVFSIVGIETSNKGSVSAPFSGAMSILSQPSPHNSCSSAPCLWASRSGRRKDSFLPKVAHFSNNFLLLQVNRMSTSDWIFYKIFCCSECILLELNHFGFAEHYYMIYYVGLLLVQYINEENKLRWIHKGTVVISDNW